MHEKKLPFIKLGTYILNFRLKIQLSVSFVCIVFL